MKLSKTLPSIIAIVLFASAWPVSAQVDLTQIAWVGDSEGMGFSSGCLSNRVQVDSPGAVIARASGVDYEQPLISDPGLGGCLVLTSLAPSFTQAPSTGQPTNLNLPRPYNNLSVGGCAIHDMLTATTGAEASAGTCRQLIDLVLRNSALHIGSAVQQAIALSPTFVFLEDVGNDYLGAVLTGTVIDGVTVTPVANVQADFNSALTMLKAAQPNGVVFGIVDVTNIPFTTTLPPFLTSGGQLVLTPSGQPISLLGPRCPTGVVACPIPSDTLVTLNAAAYLASGFGIPCAVAPSLPNCNLPLPDQMDPAGNPGVLLFADQVAFLKQRGADYNTAIQAAAAASGYKYYDTNAFLTKLKAGVTVGGLTVNAAFLSGGAFSYDGFHLTPIGYALLADDMIRFVNAQFSAQLPEPDLYPYIFNGGTLGGLAGTSASYVLLNGSETERAIQEIFTPEFARHLASLIAPHSPVLVLGSSGPVEKGHRSQPGPEGP